METLVLFKNNLWPIKAWTSGLEVVFSTSPASLPRLLTCVRSLPNTPKETWVWDWTTSTSCGSEAQRALVILLKSKFTLITPSKESLTMLDFGKWWSGLGFNTFLHSLCSSISLDMWRLLYFLSRCYPLSFLLKIQRTGIKTRKESTDLQWMQCLHFFDDFFQFLKTLKLQLFFFIQNWLYFHIIFDGLLISNA